MHKILFYDILYFIYGVKMNHRSILVVVAHPDDEALFGGAELLSHPDEYKVVVLDEYHNDIRRREFLDSMRFIGIHEYEHWTGYKGKEDYFREKLIYELLREH